MLVCPVLNNQSIDNLNMNSYLKGHWVAVIPGGAEEGLQGNNKAYKLRWGKRQGFAIVAKNTRSRVITLQVSCLYKSSLSLFTHHD